jgi:hypothetical protein
MLECPTPLTLTFWNGQPNKKRLLLTHDQNTIVKFAYDRVLEGKPMPGVIEVSRSVPISVAIDDILLIAVSSMSGKWEGQVIYLPLK